MNDLRFIHSAENFGFRICDSRYSQGFWVLGLGLENRGSVLRVKGELCCGGNGLGVRV
jgi:hypothetical protein